jgi:hypothetical protein
MKNRIIKVATLFMVVAVSGCKLMPTKDSSPDNSVESTCPSNTSPEGYVSWINFGDHLLQLTPREIANERKRAQQLLNNDESDSNRIRLALIYGLAHKGFRNITRSRQLIQAIKAPAELDKPTQQLLSMLHSQLIAEQRALGDKYRYQKDAENAEKERASLQSQIATLQEKIKALSEIERKISGKQLNGQ